MDMQFQKGLKKHNQSEELRLLESEFYRKVNQVVSNKITPIYNTIQMIYCAIFGYYIMSVDNQCFAREQNAWAINYSNTEDVTH